MYITLANNSGPIGQRLIVSEETSSTHAGDGKEKDKQLQKSTTMCYNGFCQAGIEATGQGQGLVSKEALMGCYEHDQTGIKR